MEVRGKHRRLFQAFRIRTKRQGNGRGDSRIMGIPGKEKRANEVARKIAKERSSPSIDWRSIAQGLRKECKETTDVYLAVCAGLADVLLPDEQSRVRFLRVLIAKIPALRDKDEMVNSIAIRLATPIGRKVPNRK
jgi:hypothetical protein